MLEVGKTYRIAIELQRMLGTNISTGKITGINNNIFSLQINSKVFSLRQDMVEKYLMQDITPGIASDIYVASQTFIPAGVNTTVAGATSSSSILGVSASTPAPTSVGTTASDKSTTVSAINTPVGTLTPTPSQPTPSVNPATIVAAAAAQNPSVDPLSTTPIVDATTGISGSVPNTTAAYVQPINSVPDILAPTSPTESSRITIIEVQKSKTIQNNSDAYVQANAMPYSVGANNLPF